MIADTAPDLAALRAAYASFLNASEGRILLTGHSHQAWPDVAKDALARSFDDAARFADDKWSEAVFPTIERVGQKILTRMGFAPTDAITFGKSTHELGFRLITCLPTRDRPRIVTTQSEFHSLRRQLQRLEEEGFEIVWVESRPREGLTERLIQAITPGTALVAFSTVLFEDAYVVEDLGAIFARAAEVGAIALADAYHAFNVVPLVWGAAGEGAFVTAGGYKYASFGEGMCWLRVPPGCSLRPVYTGWFAEFGDLTKAPSGRVAYADGNARFAGATFDPSSVYRAEAVLDHWDRFGLSPAHLRAISTRQTTRILAALDAAGLGEQVMSARDPARRGGFVAVRVSDGDTTTAALRQKNVFVDARRNVVRLGPAPYLEDAEIDRGVEAFIDVVRGQV